MFMNSWSKYNTEQFCCSLSLYKVGISRQYICFIWTQFKILILP